LVVKERQLERYGGLKQLTGVAKAVELVLNVHDETALPWDNTIEFDPYFV